MTHYKNRDKLHGIWEDFTLNYSLAVYSLEIEIMLSMVITHNGSHIKLARYGIPKYLSVLRKARDLN